MKVRRFEDLKVWQKAQDLAFNLYQAFRTCQDFGFKDQICRASGSIYRRNISNVFHTHQLIT